MSALFPVEIVTPAGALPRCMAQLVEVPATCGRLSVQARHQPLVCLLRAGDVRIVEGEGRERFCAVEEGIMTVDRRGVTLLTRRVASQSPST